MNEYHCLQIIYCTVLTITRSQSSTTLTGHLITGHLLTNKLEKLFAATFTLWQCGDFCFISLSAKSSIRIIWKVGQTKQNVSENVVDQSHEFSRVNATELIHQWPLVATWVNFHHSFGSCSVPTLFLISRRNEWLIPLSFPFFTRELTERLLQVAGFTSPAPQLTKSNTQLWAQAVSSNKRWP